MKKEEKGWVLPDTIELVNRNIPKGNDLETRIHENNNKKTISSVVF